jgi:4-oxalomesaconate hydratase
MLVVSAHAADFCSRAGGTVAKYAEAGSAVRVVCLSVGERGESPDLYAARPDITLAEAKAARRAEVEAAVAILGVEAVFLDWTDHPLSIGEERLLRLVEEIRAWRPEILLTHWTYDPLNQDHQLTAEAVVRACESAEASLGLRGGHPPTPWPALFFFQPTIPLLEFARFSPDTYIDITGAFERKAQALATFVSQKALVANYTEQARHWAAQARLLTGRKETEYAEPFVRYRPWVGNWFV